MEAQLVEDPAALSELAPAWDALAVANRLPLAAPAIADAWWRHLAPSGAKLRHVVVRDGSAVTGIAPLWADGRDLRLAGAGVFNRLAPLAQPGHEDQVAAAIAPALGGADVLLLEGIPVDSPWPSLLHERLPRSRPFERAVFPAPVAHLRPSFDEWLGSRSKN